MLIDRLGDARESRIAKLMRKVGESVVGQLRHALPILVDAQACRKVQASRSILSQHVFGKQRITKQIQFGLERLKHQRHPAAMIELPKDHQPAWPDERLHRLTKLLGGRAGLHELRQLLASDLAELRLQRLDHLSE